MLRSRNSPFGCLPQVRQHRKTAIEGSQSPTQKEQLANVVARRISSAVYLFIGFFAARTARISVLGHAWCLGAMLLIGGARRRAERGGRAAERYEATGTAENRLRPAERPSKSVSSETILAATQSPMANFSRWIVAPPPNRVGSAMFPEIFHLPASLVTDIILRHCLKRVP